MSGRNHSQQLPRRQSDTGIAIVFLAPAILAILLVTIVPICMAIRTSFHATNYAQVREFVGIKNYITVFSESGWLNIRNSITYVVLSLIAVIPTGVALGSLLNRKFAGKRIYQTLIFIPYVISQTITALLWKWILNGSFGPVTYVLYELLGKKIDLFSNSVGANLMLVLANAWNTTPLVIILTLAALQTVPGELLEAAKIDGATPMQSYFHITLPMIKPTIMTAIVMQSMEYFNMVTLIHTLTAGGPFGSTQTLSLATYQNAFTYWHMDLASAYGVIIFLLNIGFSLVYIRLLKGKRK